MIAWFGLSEASFSPAIVECTQWELEGKEGME